MSFWCAEMPNASIDDVSSADAVVLIVAPTNDSELPSVQMDFRQSDGCAPLFKENKAIVVVNKMYDSVQPSLCLSY
jgi:hypothetical protein